MDLSGDQLKSLQAHLAIYGLADVASLLAAAPVTNIADGYTLDIGSRFLNSSCTVNCTLIKNAAGDFLFSIIANPGDNEFAAYFPGMLPYDPWNLLDTGPFPFPDLASAEVDGILWRYIYFSTEDKTKQELLYSKFTDNTKSALASLQAISGAELSVLDQIINWTGGLYYNGDYKMPRDELLPAAGVSGFSWLSLVPTKTTVQGCVSQNGTNTNLKLQFPLLAQQTPFGGNVVKKVSLVFELSSSLQCIDESIALFRSGGDRRVGLIGEIQIGDDADLTLAGSWPLDEDEILIDTTCKLSNINSYFGNSAIAGISLPDNLEADLRLHISKEHCSLEKISFNLELENWKIADFFILTSVYFGIRIYDPGSLNVVMANFTAKATLGGSVNLICTGNYPDGEFYLGLNPETPIYLGDLVRALNSDVRFADRLAITEFSGSYNSNRKYVSFKLTVTDNSNLDIGDVKGFKLTNGSIGIYGAEKYIFKLQASFSYKFTTGNQPTLLFTGGAEYDGGWIFTAGATEEVSLADIATEFEFKPPGQLTNFKFQELSFTIDAKNSRKYFHGHFLFDFGFLDEPVDVNLLVNNTKESTDFSGKFTTKLEDKPAEFNIQFNKDTGDGYKLELQLLFTVAGVGIYLDARVDNTAPANGEKKKISEKHFTGGTHGLNLNISALLDDLLKDHLPDYRSVIPPDLLPDVTIKDIYVSYDGKEKQTNCIALLKVEGREVQLFFQLTAKTGDDTSASYAFGIQTDIDDLTGLPLVGKEMSGVSIKQLGFVYASYDGPDKKKSFTFPQLSGADGARTISPGNKKDFTSGFNFNGDIKLPFDSDPFPLALLTFTQDTTASALKDTVVPAATAATPVTPVAQSSAKWFKLNKKIGPVTVGQVGLDYKDGKLQLLISGGVTIAALTLNLNGLAVGFVVADLFKATFKPSFSLAGIGLLYSAPPVEVSASFLHAIEKFTDVNGKTTDVDVYNGAAIIKASKFTITAMGSYADVAGKTSLFVYGLYEGAIGGPAFFFVTGIAAGFGYNRKVNVPSIEEVASYPLVALAMSPEKMEIHKVLALLEKPMKNGKLPIEISLGDYWFAIGIKFTSFKIIESFVLLTVNFGTSLEFAILGLSRLSWPEKSILPDPIVYIELAVLAHFGPGSDVISVEAILTPNSYLLSKDCKLTGGFAFYTWVSGPHEGDFVVTLGGYHPKFIKPYHYPTVPRLALTWKISDVLMISGEMYYAITPTAIMAGGKWEVLFHIPIITASIVVWADMLIYWAPFRYYIDIGICIKIDADIKIAFIRIHFSLEMDAELHIWGPPFAGEAYVDWSIFSFTIPFGDSSKALPAPLSWSAFSAGFVPHKKPDTNNSKSLLAEEKSDIGVATPDPINIMISNGIIDVKGEDKIPIINPYQLSISIDSFIPVTHLEFNGEVAPDATKMKSAIGDSTYQNREQQLGVRPCGLTTNDKLAYNMFVTFVTVAKKTNEDMAFTCVAKGVTEALWGGTTPDNSNLSPGTAKVIPNVLTGLMIQPLPIPQVSSVRAFDFSNLFDRSPITFNWQFKNVQVGEAYHAFDVLGYYQDGRVAGILEKTYSDVDVEGKRQNILSLLKKGFDESLPDIHVSEMNEIMQRGITYFRAIPVLCGIGKFPQYSTDTNPSISNKLKADQI